MQISPGNQIETFTIFLSSAGDLANTRDDFTDLVEKVVNPSLYNQGTSIQLRVDRWEDDAPRRPAGSHVNAEFVRRARASNVVVVLLRDKLGDGTVEEYEAVLNQGSPTPELSVFRFAKSTSADPAEVERVDEFCRQMHEHLIVKDSLGSPKSIKTWNEIFRFLLDLILTILTLRYAKPGDTSELR